MGTVVATFDSQDAARRAVDDLIAAGFPPERISVLAHDQEPADPRSQDVKVLGPLAGAFVGAGLARIFPALLSVAGFAVPGLGSIVALGPFAAAGGGLIGGLVGFLVAQGLSRSDAERHAERVRAGGYLVAVECDGADAERAGQILARAGAEAPTWSASAPTR
jgi:hypothetical protein